MDALVSLSTYPISQRLVENIVHRKKSMILPSQELISILKLVTGAFWTGLWDVLDICRGRRSSGKSSRTLKTVTAVTVVALLSW